MELVLVQVDEATYINPHAILMIEGIAGDTRITFKDRPGYVMIERPVTDVLKALEGMNRG